MKDNYKDAYKKFLDAWGEDAQIMITIEEMSELTKELCKYVRVKNYCTDKKIEDVRKDIVEELADVLNTVEQMILIFGEEDVQKERDYKLARTLKRLEKSLEKTQEKSEEENKTEE